MRIGRKVRAEHAPADAKLYNNLLFGPMQGTGGSTAIANSFEQMRQAGATARAMLVQAAANAWHVPAGEITVENGVIRHATTSREGRFGEFAAAAAGTAGTRPEKVTLKDPAAFKLIGKDDGSVKRLDSAAKSNGTALFTMDIQIRACCVAVVAHPPRFGAQVASVDATGRAQCRGSSTSNRCRPVSLCMRTRPGRRFVLASAADHLGRIRSREARQRADHRSYRALARTPGRGRGNARRSEAALATAIGVIEAEYVVPYLAHSPMEPLDGYLTLGRAAGAGALRLPAPDRRISRPSPRCSACPPERVAIETMLAGGSFGRRGEPDPISRPNSPRSPRHSGRDVRSSSSGHARTTCAAASTARSFVHRLRGAVRDGRIVAWSDTVVGQSFITVRRSSSSAMQDGVDAIMVEGAKELPYEIENFHCDLHIATVGVPVLSWRSVGHTHTGFAVETFVDELLQAAGKDPVAGRLAMLAKAPREAGVLRAVAELARWNGPGPVNGRARGVAVVKSFNTYVAQIAEVSLGEDGEPRVHKVWCAVDCGVAVNPDVIRAQMEGGIGYGLGHALYGEITLDEGRVVQSNFDTYRSLRIHEMPEIEVTIVLSRRNRPASANPACRRSRRRSRMPSHVYRAKAAPGVCHSSGGVCHDGHTRSSCGLGPCPDRNRGHTGSPNRIGG